ncbi:MAG: Rrf2 family transcriptional regulator [Candidatus Margulisiibacteriota bacterium]|nr:Rrf2 family transcriptional regulator [Candidatus Margulisiibacteriota bacterium]
MKLTRSSDYAVRLLIHLAREGEGTSRKFARDLKIPFNHLSKVVQTLARKGYLISRKGKGGGISLAKEPSKIVVGKVIEDVEGPMVLSECILNLNACSFSKSCKFRKKLTSIKKCLHDLFSTTISELA